MNKKTIMLTGATGTIGSAIVKKLIKNYNLVVLLRGTDLEATRERLRKLVGDIADQVRIVLGDMNERHCGISYSERENLKSMKIDEFFHGAASLKFFSPKTQVLNITGTENVLYLMEELGISKITFLSTAYVAGKTKKFHDDDSWTEDANNDYEESKRVCEAKIKNSGFRYVILRPSIVTGNDVNGEIATFSGYYGWFKGWYDIKVYLSDLWKRKRSLLEENGIYFTDEGILNLPLIVNCGPRPCSLNLMPVNVLSDQISQIVQKNISGEIFNVINPSPPPVQDVIIESLKYLGIQGYQFAFEQEKNSTKEFLRNLKDKLIFFSKIPYGYLSYRLQKMKDSEAKFVLNRLYPKSFLKGLQWKLNKGLDPFLSYVTQGPDFGDQQKVKDFLGENYLAPRQFDFDHYSLLLEYAIQNCYSKGGKNLDSSEVSDSKSMPYKKAA